MIRIQFVSRANSSAELLVGFSKSHFLSSSPCSLLLEFTHHLLPDKSPGWYHFTHSDITGQRLPIETHGVAVTAPSTWHSLADFTSAKEYDMRLLLRCLKVSGYVHSLAPTSSFDFAESNPDFYCCDYGEWQVFVGHKLMSGLIATPSSFDHPNANIDRIYGLNTEVLDAFVRRSKA
ncbi:hypothetical protein KIN20_036764 [Parelaphostrongylus tenuis]|uniref:Uncharacterized protein n=1 Tax=Parelaphostrongylus tenuis TaxID=148309 RepID=A0AAD5RGQ8_PARTN|nr:hypothetical protein KIN20_036764 [Parelaphostrongylus tenuis]